ncbi:hypothetical protein [Niastella sp. OAS944]|uniref:hypothetical protein n=1 Tax=Niastella sp. OAS944 TaxID=2664089 RepID=UPI00347ECA90|nr:hypothetical protein [Chitinophagaceae bacterium OAS944]
MTHYNDTRVEKTQSEIIVHLISTKDISKTLSFTINFKENDPAYIQHLTNSLFGEFFIVSNFQGTITLVRITTLEHAYVTHQLLSKLVKNISIIAWRNKDVTFIQCATKWENDITALEKGIYFSKSSIETKGKPQSEVTIYIVKKPSLHEQENIVNACGEFMEALGFEMKTQNEPIYNSFWQKIRFVFKKNVTEQDVQNIFDKAKKALELKHIDLPTAEQTEKLANAVDKILNSVNRFDNCTIRLGSLLIVKRMIEGEPMLKVHQLTPDEIKYLEANDSLLKEADPLAPPIKINPVINTIPEDTTGGLPEQAKI